MSELKWQRHVVHSENSIHWRTDEKVFRELDLEFGFDFDPCPYYSLVNGLEVPWTGRRVFCNPPYKRGEIAKWLAKHKDAAVAVYLLPSRTGTRWWHEFSPQAEVRYFRGRLRFGGVENTAPFDSVLLIFDHSESEEDRGTES